MKDFAEYISESFVNEAALGNKEAKKQLKDMAKDIDGSMVAKWDTKDYTDILSMAPDYSSIDEALNMLATVLKAGNFDTATCLGIAKRLTHGSFDEVYNE